MYRANHLGQWSDRKEWMRGRCFSLGHGEAALASWPLSYRNAAVAAAPSAPVAQDFGGRSEFQHDGLSDRNVGSRAREWRCSMTGLGHFGEGRAGGRMGARQRRVDRQPGNWTRPRWTYVGGAQQAKISPRAPNQAVGRLCWCRGNIGDSRLGGRAPIGAPLLKAIEASNPQAGIKRGREIEQERCSRLGQRSRRCRPGSSGWVGR